MFYNSPTQEPRDERNKTTPATLNSTTTDAPSRSAEGQKDKNATARLTTCLFTLLIPFFL